VGLVISIATAITFLIISLVVHELAHVLAVNYLGGKVEKVGIFPLGFAARFRKLESLRAWERYIIYGAGALANAILAAWTFSVSRLSYFGIAWLEELAFYNLVLCIFNLIPILPLDGGRILHQFLSNRIGILRASRIMVRFGLWFSILLIILGFLQVILYSYNITLLCAALYIRRQNKEIVPTLQMEFFQYLNAKTAREKRRLMPVRKIKIPQNSTLKYALEHLTIDHFTEFILDEKTHTLPESMLLNHVFNYGLHGRISDFLN